jgi:hypothetical protein
MTTNAPTPATGGNGKWVILCFLAFAVGNGCQKTEAPDPAKQLVGKNVTVQFRRDALGSAATIPVSPFTNNLNGADTSFTGKVYRVDGNWLVVDFREKRVWVPREVVLAIEEMLPNQDKPKQP